MSKLLLMVLSFIVISNSVMAGAVVSLSDSEMETIAESSLKKDDVIVIVRAPVDIKPGRLTPKISYEVRKLRRSDTVIYDSDKDGSPVTSCLIIMIVPKENVSEILKRIDADNTLMLITPDRELIEEVEFPDLTTIKDRSLDFISVDGK